jgi:hypothetical protein
MDHGGLWQTALHEASHALRAHGLGWRVLSLRCSGPHNGATAIRLPVMVEEVEEQYAVAPSLTKRHLIQTVSVLNAPMAVGEPCADGADLQMLLAYRRAWEATRCIIGWPVLAHEARQLLRQWVNRPGCLEQVYRVADALAARRFLNREQFLQLVQPTPQPLASEDTLCDVSYRPFGYALGMLRW